MKTLIPFAALAALMSLTPAPATASTTPPVHSRTVAFSDLDLGSADGRRVLDLRLQHAAAEVCGDPSYLDLVGQRQATECRVRTAEAARIQIDRQLAAAASNLRIARAD